MIHPHRVLQYCLIKKHLHLVVLFRFHLAADSVLVSFTRFHFDEGGHIPLHIIKATLQSERFADIRRFKHRIRLVQFVSGSMKSIIHRFADMLEMQFAIIKELTFLLSVPQIGASRQFDGIAAESLLHTSPIINILVRRMNPFIQKEIGNISQ